MSTWLSSGPFAASLPEHCLPQNDFLTRISSDFHTCVPTPLAFFSTLLGSLSIVSWLFAQLPQIIKNYKVQSTAGLSIYFLIEWCLGDTTNLLGALLTGQATWQVIVAAYYVCVDVVLVSQYFWYTHFIAWRKGGDEWETQSGRRDGDDSTEVIEGIPTSDQSSLGSLSVDDGNKPMAVKSDTKIKQPPFNSPRSTSSFSLSREKSTPPSSRRIITRSGHSPLPIISPQTVLAVSLLCAVLTNAAPVHPIHSSIHTVESSRTTENIGRLLSWISTVLYLGSRLPQIFKNYSRRSTAGLSPALFAAAFFGNLFYSSSLLANPLAWASYPPFGLHGWVGAEGSDRETWVALAAPFWLGAAGVLALDGAIGVQFLIYGEERVLVVRDGRGRGHWRKVTGWMRGWVPSPSPRRENIGDVSEERSLLNEETRSGDNYGTA